MNDGEVSTRAAASSLSGTEETDLVESVLDVLPVRLSVLDRGLHVRFVNSAALSFYGITSRALLGSNFADFVDPAGMAAQRERFDRALAGQHVRYERTTALPSGHVSYDVVELEPLVEEGEVVAILMLVHDDTANVHAHLEARLNSVDAAIRGERLKLAFALDHDVIQRLDHASAGLQAALASEPPDARLRSEAAIAIDEAIRALRERIHKLKSPLPPRRPDPQPVPVETTQRITVPDVPPETDAMRRSSSGLAPSLLRQALDRLPMAVAAWTPDHRCVLANAAAHALYGEQELEGSHGEDILGPEVYATSATYGELALSGDAQQFLRTVVRHGAPRHERVDYLPRVVAGEVVGAVAVLTDMTGEVTSEELFQRSAAEVALLQDRTRIAEDIHDLVVQALFAAGLLIGRDTGDVRGRVGAALESIETAREELRIAVLEMSAGHEPEPLIDVSTAVRRSVAEVAKAVSYPVRFEFHVVRRLLPAGLVMEVAAVATEAVSNAARHAQASVIEVDLRADRTSLTLTVTDDGRGLGTPERSSGLTNMARRAERHGGEMRLPPRERGTRVEWSILLTDT